MEMPCGMTLASITPWTTVVNPSGSNSWFCKYCTGMWRGKKGRSRELIFMDGQGFALRVAVYEPPPGPWQRFLNQKMANLRIFEPLEEARDVPLDPNQRAARRIEASQALSDLIWAIVLFDYSKPVREHTDRVALEAIRAEKEKMAAQQTQPRPQMQVGGSSSSSGTPPPPS